ncbi:AMIN domain-containing protein [Paenibacillaceae bacterium]|nr:AMIN domain-containing protein [Paenibacillaceae bacterium]
MMKKLVSLLLTLSVMFILFPGTGQASTVPKILLDGKELASDVEPTIVNNNTLVPISIIAGGLNYQAVWNKDSRTVGIHNNDTQIVLAINDSKALVNGQEVEMGEPARIISGRTMVPLRFVGEQLGLEVSWDNAKKEASLFSKQDGNPLPVTPPNPGDGTETQPSGALNYIALHELDPNTIVIRYSGDIVPNQAFSLTDTDRIVLDLPNTAFADDIYPSFPLNDSKQGSLDIESHEFLQKVRFAPLQGKESTARVVLDLYKPVGYTVTNNPGEITIQLGTELPKPPEEVKEEPVPDKGNNGNNGGKVFKVVIDAGHGDHDSGAVGVNKTKEKDFNLAIALRVKKLLDQEPNIEAYMTRSDDSYLTLDNRAKYANDLKADVFMSIHANSFTKPSANGTETYYSRSDSKALAEVVHKHLIKATGLADRKVKQAGYVVIKKTTMPAILVESGFLSNAGDESVLNQEAVRDRIAAALVAGIKEFLKLS